MDDFLHVFEPSDTFSAEQVDELNKQIRELQDAVNYWKTIAEERKRLLNKALELWK